MIIYIAGPITGVVDYRERFEMAQRALMEKGHTVLNPAVLPDGLGDRKVYMTLCLPMVDLADAVLFLPDWEQSPGANQEYGYAMALNKIVLNYEDYMGGEP